MRIELNKKSLEKYPLSIRTISLKDNNIVIVDFQFVDDLDMCITFTKEYDNNNTAIESINFFLKNEKRNFTNHSIEIPDFESVVKKSKKSLFKDVIEEKIELPDQGSGYEFLGDKNYLGNILKINRF